MIKSFANLANSFRRSVYLSWSPGLEISMAKTYLGMKVQNLMLGGAKTTLGREDQRGWQLDSFAICMLRPRFNSTACPFDNLDLKLSQCLVLRRPLSPFF